MAVVMRNNAALADPRRSVGESHLRGGGSGRGPYGTAIGKVRTKARYSHDPAAELMPAAEFLGAEPDFSAILEDFRDSPFDPRRRRVLGRLMGVFAMDYQGARAEERGFLRRLLAARNAREGYVANRALHLLKAPQALRRTLALGVAESRYRKGPAHGFLGAVQARIAAATFMLLGPRGREQVWDALTAVGRRGDPVAERALILKAVGARRHRLGPWSEGGDRALGEVTAFATAIRDEPREALAQRTDGEAARAQIDPVFAWAASSRATGQETREDIYHALPALDRGPLKDRPRLHQALAEARIRPDLMATPQAQAVSLYLSGQELSLRRLALVQEATAHLMARGFDIMAEDTLRTIRDDARGLYKFDASAALGLLLSRYSGATYVRREVSDQLTAGLDPADAMGAALSLGLPVPLLIREPRPAHSRAWMVTGGSAAELHLALPPEGRRTSLSRAALRAMQLPPALGRKARAEAYFDPAPLDLLAAPFGIPFPDLGITDAL
jgi:hypothetical protein